jgi:hypothetical protein
MKLKILTSIIVILFAIQTQAQNPFKELGVEVEVLTLSKGKYCEFFPNDTIVRIGSVIFNTITNQIVDLVVIDSTNINDLRLRPYLTCRWLSVDPLAEKYPEWSPYNFCAGNPIRNIDFTGRDWVDANGNLIYSNGAYTKYATESDKHLGTTLQKTETGKAQFEKLNSPGQETRINFSNEVIKDKEGYVLGYTDNVKEGKSTQSKDMKTGKIVEVDVEKSVITIYTKAIDEFMNEAKEGGAKLGNTSITKDMKTDDVLGAITGHEIEHTTDENMTISVTEGGKAAEVPANEISNKILNEVKKLNEK